MATSPEGKIEAALMKRVATNPLSLPIAWPNVDFNVPASRKYLRVQHIPNTVTRQHINSDGAHRFLGILQVSVHWPKDVGGIAPREAAGVVVAHFPCDLKLIEDGVEVRIMQRPTAEDVLIGDADVQIPVMIQYESVN